MRTTLFDTTNNSWFEFMVNGHISITCLWHENGVWLRFAIPCNEHHMSNINFYILLLYYVFRISQIRQLYNNKNNAHPF